MNDITNTYEYEFSHGKKPRGNGYWGFEITFEDGSGRFSTETVWAHGTLTSARKLAWAELKAGCSSAKSAIEIKVLP